MEMTNRIVKIMQTLRSMGMREDLGGFMYTVSAVDLILAADTVSLQYCGPKGIYGQVGALYNTTDKRVERSLIYVIRALYSEGAEYQIDEVVGKSCALEKGFPTVSTFLCSVANYIRMQEYEDVNRITYHPRPVNADGDLVFAPDLAERKYVAGWGGGAETGRCCPNLTEVITRDTEA